MENATKAVIMVGEILVGVLILTLIARFFAKGNAVTEEYNSNMSAQELAAFNAKFEAYNCDGLSYDDIISVANMAFDYNKQSSYDENNSIEILFRTADSDYIVDCDTTEKGKFNDRN